MNTTTRDAVAQYEAEHAEALLALKLADAGQPAWMAMWLEAPADE